jgi:crotonobetainyl-CoA:carnitine CoA-transferase CaiB-like acyl-CoA transferase
MLPTNDYGDFQMAFVLLSGILGALMQPELSGDGDYVTTSLYHSGGFMLNAAMIPAQYGDQYPKDRREVIGPFSNTYFGCDGGLMTMCAAEYDRDFDKIMKLVGREDLVGEEWLNVCDNVNANGLNGEVVDILDEALAKQPMDYWLTLFLENDVPLEKCQIPQDVYNDEQAWANDMLRKVTHKTGAVRMIPTNPVRFQSQGNRNFASHAEKVPTLKISSLSWVTALNRSPISPSPGLRQSQRAQVAASSLTRCAGSNAGAWKGKDQHVSDTYRRTATTRRHGEGVPLERDRPAGRRARREG